MNEQLERISKYLSEERIKFLLEKWGPILNAPPLTKEEQEAKLKASIIIESQEHWLSDEPKRKI